MKKDAFKMARYLCLLTTAILFSGTKIDATPIDGAELYYSSVSGNTYKISLVIYGSCGVQGLPNFYTATPQIKVYEDPNTTPDTTLTLSIEPPDSGIAVPGCSLDTNTTCFDINNPILGKKKFVYSVEYTLPYVSANWRFQFQGNLGATQGKRSSTLTNLVNPGSTILELDAKLNNAITVNTSPAYDSILKPYYCLNIASNYQPIYHDLDGDSLTFALIPGINASGFPQNPPDVTYTPSHTGINPMDAAPFVFDSTSGQINFTGNLIQKSLVVMEIREYRNGTLVGTSQREMTVAVTDNCDNYPPCINAVVILNTPLTANQEINVEISPNPATDELNITAGGTISKIQVYNMMGQKLYEENMNGRNIFLPLKQHAISNGLYSIAIYTNTGVIRRTFVVAN